MRVIFLDVDGVLNNDSTIERYNGFVGVDNKLLANLKKFYDLSNNEEETKIVITSSWRLEKIKKDCVVDGSYEYLLNKIKESGMDCIGETPENETRGSWYRGSEIEYWLNNNIDKNITGFIVLDDEIFDFEEIKILQGHYLITTNFYKENGGFSESDIEPALEIIRLPILKV